MTIWPTTPRRPENATVSVIISTFNRAALTIRAVESVLSQTHVPIELIVVDDGSTDDTRDRLSRFAQRLTYISQSNQGVSAARNAGIRRASGDWIALLDSDDIWLPAKLENQLRALSTCNGNCLVSFTDARLRRNDNPDFCTAFSDASFRMTRAYAALDSPRDIILAPIPAIYLPTLLFHRQLWERCGNFDERLPVSEDTDFIFRLSLHSRFCAVNEVLAELDVRPNRAGSLSKGFTKKESSMFRARFHMYNNWLEHISKVQDPDLARNIALKRRHTCYNWLLTALRHYHIAEAFAILQLIRRNGDGTLLITTTLVRRFSRKLTRNATLAAKRHLGSHLVQVVAFALSCGASIDDAFSLADLI